MVFDHSLPNFNTQLKRTVRQAQAKMTYLADFEKDNYILKDLGSGAYGTVYASIPKTIADQILAALRSSSRPVQVSAAKVQLRAGIEAAKISKGGKSFGRQANFKAEIEILQVLNEAECPNIVATRRADSSEYGWLVMEPLAGGDFIDFRKFIKTCGNRNPLPCSLAWHFIHELANALFFMYAQSCIHSDLGERNIMLRPRGAYKNYPDVVLVDFGMASTYGRWLATSSQDTLERRHEFLGSCVRDLNSLHFSLQSLLDQLSRNCVALQATLVNIKSYRVRKGADAAQHYKMFLEKLRDEASRMRDQEYKELPGVVLAYLRKRDKMVSDAELERVFPDLVSREDSHSPPM